MTTDKNIVALAGGVGGAKMVNGLAQVVPPEKLFIIGNTADDFEHLGLSISPDLDTVMYALAGINNAETGWGLNGESWRTMATLEQLGGPVWFKLGDKDLATHLLRTHWRDAGYPLSWITAQLCRRLGVKPTLMPMTDQPVKTILHTDRGKLGFQDYFVRHHFEPVVHQIEFEGAETAAANREILSAIRLADVIVFAPSNPLLSLDPILAIPGLRRMIAASRARKIAVSPIIGGAAVKGPLAKLMAEFGLEVSPFGVAEYLKDLLTDFVLDAVDEIHAARIEGLGLRAIVTDTLMKSVDDQVRLAREILV